MIMEIEIKVIKVLPNELKEVYWNTVKLPVGISFSFETLLNSLRLLYPDCTYQFNME